MQLEPRGLIEVKGKGKVIILRRVFQFRTARKGKICLVR